MYYTKSNFTSSAAPPALCGRALNAMLLFKPQSIPSHAMTPQLKSSSAINISISVQVSAAPYLAPYLSLAPCLAVDEEPSA